MPPSLTVRNLSPTPLELVLIERFKPVAVSINGPSSILKNLTNLSRNASSALSGSKLTEESQCFSALDLSIQIPAFTVRDASIPVASPTQEPQTTALRLTFLAGSQKYRMDVPAPKLESQTLQCLAPQPQFRFTGFHVRQLEGTYVAICNSAELNCWMRRLIDETPLSALSIPGTHNSPTCYKALPSVRCQAVSLREQLENGVRFFDVRVQPDSKSNHLTLVHSTFSVSLTSNKYFHDILSEIYAFLDANPSETLIMSVKREGTGMTTDHQLSRILLDTYTGDSTRWYISPDIPQLGAVRGKIVLLRRFQAPPDLTPRCGLDASTWPDNTPHAPGATICVQDYYEVLETHQVARKIEYATAQLQRAGACTARIPGVDGAAHAAAQSQPPPSNPLFLNFLSGSNFWRVACWPEEIARKLNPAIMEYLIVRHAVDDAEGARVSKDFGLDKGARYEGYVGDGSTGIVVCDWVGAGGDWDLVRCIVAMNCKLMIREHEGEVNAGHGGQ